MVVAPAAMTCSIIRHRKSISERPASSGENSTLLVYSRAHFTDFTACSITCEGSMRSFFSMWMGLVAINVCTRGDFAPLTASPQRRTSFSFARASPHTVLSRTAAATALTDAKSPSLAAGNPASITSTRMRSNWRAMRSFSSLVIDAPGLCSPSRMVVSNMINFSFFMAVSALSSSWRAASGQKRAIENQLRIRLTRPQQTK